jgi:hypothetical protein
MGAAMSTFTVLVAWAIPIVIALIIMSRVYRSPAREELEQADQVQPD